MMMIIWVVGELEFLERWIGGKVPGLAPLPSDTFTRGLPPQPVSILARQCNTLARTRGTTCLSASRFNTLGGVSGVLPPCLSPAWSFAGAMDFEVHFVQIAECFPAFLYNVSVTLGGWSNTWYAACLYPRSSA